MSKATELLFGVIPIPLSQVFLLRKNVYGMVNLKPFVPGHVLLCTRKIVPRLQQLDEAQTVELFITAQQICQKLESTLNMKYEISLQNGEEAGQTVKHLHLHLVPKYPNPGIERFSDLARSKEDMAEQAAKYRKLFEQ